MKFLFEIETGVQPSLTKKKKKKKKKISRVNKIEKRKKKIFCFQKEQTKKGKNKIFHRCFKSLKNQIQKVEH